MGSSIKIGFHVGILQDWQSLSEEINQGKNMFFRSDQVSVQMRTLQTFFPLFPSLICFLYFWEERGKNSASLD